MCALPWTQVASPIRRSQDWDFLVWYHVEDPLRPPVILVGARGEVTFRFILEGCSDDELLPGFVLQLGFVG